YRGPGDRSRRDRRRPLGATRALAPPGDGRHETSRRGARASVAAPGGLMQRRMLAAALAALAEAGLAFLIVARVTSEGANAVHGPLLSYPLFTVLFVGGVLLGLRLPGIRGYAVGALVVAFALALLQGLVWGHGDALGVSLLVVVNALAAARTVTLV